MIEIKIDENFSISKDSTCWTLRYYKEGELNEKGNPTITKRDWYYPNLQAGLKGYIDSALKYEDVQSVTDILNKLKEIETNIENLKL